MDGADSKYQELNESSHQIEAIPTSYWQSKGYNRNYIRYLEGFIIKLNYQTQKMNEANSTLVRLSIGSYYKSISHDDAFYPFWQKFARALQSYHHDIRELSITNTQLPKRVLDILNQALQNKNITALKLIKNDFGRDGVMFMSDILRACPSLNTVVSERNEISCLDAATHLSHALENHPCLKELCVNKCGLGNNNEILSVVLNGVKNLRSVHLSGNQIGPLGYVAISEMLVTNISIQSLDLCHNSVDDYGAFCLAQSLRKNSSLKWLDLTGLEISLRGKKSLYDAIFDKSSLSAVSDSNHTCVLRVYRGDGRCIKILAINQYRKAKENRILKLFLALHGTKGKVMNMKYFDDLRLRIMPYVFEFLQKDPFKSKGLNNIFEALHWKMPLLFDSCEISSKRKRQKVASSSNN